MKTESKETQNWKIKIATMKLVICLCLIKLNIINVYT